MLNHSEHDKPTYARTRPCFFTAHVDPPQDILRELKAKADRSYQQYRNRHASPALDIQLDIGPEAEIANSRLAIFGGQTRVMSSKLLTRRRPGKRPTSQSQPASSPSPTSATHADSPPRDSSPGASTTASTPSESGSGSSSSVPQNVSDAFAEVHPSLVEYLSLIPSSASFAVVDPPPQQQVPMNGSNGNGVNGAGMSGLNGSETTPTATNGFGGQTPVGYAQDMNGMTSFPPFFTDPSMQQQQQAMGPGMPGMEFFGSADPSLAALSMPDLGFTEDVMMTDHWMNLMRQTGIMDSNGNYTIAAAAQQPGQAQQFSTF